MSFTKRNKERGLTGVKHTKKKEIDNDYTTD